jgi:hypothetical protein
MRISDILVPTRSTKKVKKLSSRFVFLGMLITGLVSSIVIFVTIYGQYTGTFTLSMQKDAIEKGIQLSESVTFENPKSILNIQPLTEIGDMTESAINFDEARNTDGQYYDPVIPYYIAYTFYMRNSGKEVVDINYRLTVLDSYKNVDKAVKVRYVSENLDTGEYIDKTYVKGEKQHIIDEVLNNFIEGHTLKITIFLWFDGELTDASMMGGSLKLNLTYTIVTADTNGVLS